MGEDIKWPDTWTTIPHHNSNTPRNLIPAWTGQKHVFLNCSLEIWPHMTLQMLSDFRSRGFSPLFSPFLCAVFSWEECFCENDNFVSWQCPSVWRQMCFQMAANAWAWTPAVGWVWPYHSWPRSPWIPWLITQQPITFSPNLFFVFYYTEGPLCTDKSGGNLKLTLKKNPCCPGYCRVE